MQELKTRIVPDPTESEPNEVSKKIDLPTVVVDDTSPPGAWKLEFERHPWGYGQAKKIDTDEALWNIRKAGLWNEANVLALEITGLRAEIDRMTK